MTTKENLMKKYFKDEQVYVNKEEFVFQALEWVEFNEEKNDEDDEKVDADEEEGDLDFFKNKDNDEKYILRIFGVTKEGSSVCLNVENFTPFFYVKVPETWKIQNVKTFLSKLSEKLVVKKNNKWVNCSKNLISSKCVLQRKKDFFGFSNNEEFLFLRLVFNNSDVMKRAVNAIKSHNKGVKKLTGITSLPLYEANVDSSIKIAHIKNLNFAGWIKVTEFEQPDFETRRSLCNIEANIDWQDLQYHNDNSNAPILQASYDIETYSIDGSFPSPDVKGNVVTQIATAFKIYGKDDFYIKHIICLKQCAHIDDPTVIVECYDTEREVLLAWVKLITKMDPDILYQYNGDWFDGHYLYTRAVITDCEDEFLLLGRVKDVLSKIDEKSFSSSAYGANNYRRLTMPGRINFDVLTYIKREYKENSYKLDYISEKYLGQNKNPVTPKMMFEYFESGDPEKIKIIAEYCVQDTLLPQRLVDKMHILQNQISMANIAGVPIRFLTERGQQIKVFSQILKETRKHKYLVPTIDNYREKDQEKEDEESFTGATVLPPLSGAYFEPITVCDFASLYPSIIRAHNLCYSTIVLDEKYANIEGVEYKTFDWEDVIKDKVVKHTYKYVQSTEGVLQKLLNDLTLTRKEYKKLMGSTDDPFLKEVYNKCQLAVKVSMNSFYGFFASHMLCCKPIAATVTAIGRNMIQDTKKYMEEAYKNSAVAVYGDTDSVFIKFKTASTEQYKEQFTKYQKSEIKTQEDKNKVEELKRKCIQESIDLGKVAAQNATKALFKYPINLEYEKVYLPLLLLSKKRYIGILYSEDACKADKMDNKGVILKRRDNFDLLKRTYRDVLDILLESGVHGMDRTKDYIEDIIWKIINGDFDNLDDFIISKSLKADYISQNIPHVVLAKKLKERDPGNAPKSNDRVPYVFIEPNENTDIGKELCQDFIDRVKKKAKLENLTSFDEAKLINKTFSRSLKFKTINQYQKVEDPDYVLKNKLPLDAEYYIKFMKKPLCEILALFIENPEKIFDDIIKEYNNSKW